MFCTFVISLLIWGVHGNVTIYTDQSPFFATSVVTSSFPNYTAASAFDPTSLTPPAVPSPPIPTQFPVQLFSGGMANLSLPQTGAFVGFSVELSIADTIFFLNLMANIQARAGRSVVRVGGNTQEKAVFFPQGLPGGATLLKTESNPNTPHVVQTDTPTIEVGIDLIFAMANISSLVNTQWYIGVPFNDTTQPRLGIAEASEQILGEYLLGLQVANEPDLYGTHGLRPSTYAPADFVQDYQTMITAIQTDTNIKNKTNLIGPSLCCFWTPEQVFDAGFLNFADSLAYLAVEHYADTRCPDGHGNIKQSQDALPEYMSHTLAVSQMLAYLNTANIAQAHGKPLIMMETNTASCGGFPGLSDSFGAALWGLDWALQMAYSNFSGAMMHVGGQNVYYNPFTPPPGALVRKAQWTIGPMYYVALIVSEIFGSSNASRITDLFQNSNNPFTPGYAIYENGNPMRVALFNFITDPSGASNYTAQISIGGGTTGQQNATPSKVFVRYFTAPSVTTKGGFVWAGQTFGGTFSSNGIPQGTLENVTINCDTTNNVCSVPVPAPGFALVFLTDEALEESTPNPTAHLTFATTVTTVSLRNTVTIDPAVLATSNGHGGLNQQRGSTSFGSSGAVRTYSFQAFVTFLCVIIGFIMVTIGNFVS
ncbi:glycoside hydrolase family 79 protein [Hysterangium stoloniferum]|nr:glycoside hydrolase family 79 protein [Hysterangium stoloniferum]